MVYESQISITLDTICPWTYLAKSRLQKALAQVEATDPPARFTIKYLPYQLYPEASQEGEDKHEWYRKTRYGDSEEKMKLFIAIMTTYGNAVGIKYKFGGSVANTIHAHRLIQHFQKERGPEVADKIVSSLCRQYFEEEKHPSADDTLLTAAVEAGISEVEAKDFIANKDGDMKELQALIREQTSNDVEAVPQIVIEGRKRDFTMIGCREVDEYVKTLNQVIKESS